MKMQQRTSVTRRCATRLGLALLLILCNGTDPVSAQPAMAAPAKQQPAGIVFALYTVQDGVMKMTAQMPPIARSDSQYVSLHIKEKQRFKTIAKAKIDKLSRTATFRIDNWPDKVDTPYMLIYAMKNNTGQIKNYSWQGTVRKDPVDKTDIVVAAFTGNYDLGFPNNDLVKSVAFHDPDLLFFSGDQIYEGVGGYGAQRKPLDSCRPSTSQEPPTLSCRLSTKKPDASFITSASKVLHLHRRFLPMGPIPLKSATSQGYLSKPSKTFARKKLSI